jgi:SAM-dependent methyltransferase
MPEIVALCPLCKSSQHSLFEITRFRGQQVFNHICDGCGFVFQSPRMTEPELDAFYAGEYRQVYQGEAGPTQKDLTVQDKRASALLAFVRGSIPSIRRHLDIGCSAGILLQKFQSHYGCLAVGVEPGDTYRTYAQTKGITVFPDITQVPAGVEARFDLVSMAHVLEHIPDPVAYLVKLREDYTASGGYILIEVPNLYAHDSFEIAHMSSFSEHTLVQTLIKSGFSIIATRKHGIPRSRILPLYLTVLAQAKGLNAPSGVVPEKMVRRKRRFGMLTRRIVSRLVPSMAWNLVKFEEQA